MATVLICDDRGRLADRLRRRVATLPGVDRVATAHSLEAALGSASSDPPAVVFFDLALCGGTPGDAVRRMVSAYPHAPVVLLSGTDDRDRVACGIREGARGYLNRSASTAEVCAVLAGVLGDVVEPPPERPPPTEPAVLLTERELQVLTGMASGKTNAEIGRELYLSEDTVKTHARRLFRKLDAADRAQAVALGFRRGLVR